MTFSSIVAFIRAGWTIVVEGAGRVRAVWQEWRKTPARLQRTAATGRGSGGQGEAGLSEDFRARGIDGGAVDASCRMSLGESLDLVVDVPRLLGGDVAAGDRLADRVPPAGRRGHAQHLAVAPDRLAAIELHRRVDQQSDQPAPRAGRFGLFQRGPSNEVGLLLER